MKATFRNLSRFIAVLTLLTGWRGNLAAQETPAAPAWRYVLLSGSYLLDDCPVCARPSIQEPMRGTFDLRVAESTPQYSRYSLENVNFTAGTSRTYTVKGSGEFDYGGEVAIVQRMSMEVDIDDGNAKKACELISESAPASRALPMMDITVEQTNGTFTQVYSLRIAAAPVRDLWFSTVNFFTAGAGPEASSTILGGDLISTFGRVVKRNSFFYTSVGAPPPGSDLGLDAVDVLPGGEFAFSLNTGFPMTSVGPVYHGDLLSTKGRVIRRNGELLAGFGLQPIAPDVGLDAVHVLDSGEILFSIETDIFSEKLGALLHRGDLLSSTGKIERTYKELLQKLHPSTSPDPGLDALYQWPGGEIWFSTELPFTDNELGPIAAGDLLSDQGYLVFRNADLLSAFAPQQATPDFGLDGVFIVTDATPPPGAAQLNIAIKKSGMQDVSLTWQSPARVVQVERSTNISDLFLPVSPIIPDFSWEDSAALQSRPRAFYRLRQW